jgi:putative beta-lysine N-acetyltransferase
VTDALYELTTDRRLRVEGRGFRAEANASELNQRLQVLSYGGEDVPALVASLRERAQALDLGKVFLKVRKDDAAAFGAAGLVTEAAIAGYFDGSDAAVMSLFVDPERRQRPHLDEEERILRIIQGRPKDPSLPALPNGYFLRRASAADAPELARLYRAVFASYPFPITEPAYLRETMATHIVYRLVRDDRGEIVAAASAETNPDYRSSEMTDFATLSSQRGLGLAQHLLAALEEDMADCEITNLHTVARARSLGMNRVFFNRGYHLTGTLVNNCHIAGQFEDMHVWSKVL